MTKVTTPRGTREGIEADIRMMVGWRPTVQAGDAVAAEEAEAGTLAATTLDSWQFWFEASLH